jgi:hypothetical protein
MAHHLAENLVLLSGGHLLHGVLEHNVHERIKATENPGDLAIPIELDYMARPA